MSAASSAKAASVESQQASECVLADGEYRPRIRIPFRTHVRPLESGCVLHRIIPGEILVCAAHKYVAVLQ